MAGRATYFAYQGRGMRLFAVGFMVVVLAVMWVAVLRGTESPTFLLVLVPMTALLAWVAFVNLTRVAHEVVVGDDQVTWSAPLRSGSFPLEQLAELRPHSIGTGPIVVLVDRDGRVRAQVQTGPGFMDFADELTEAAPHARISPGLVARWNR